MKLNRELIWRKARAVPDPDLRAHQPPDLRPAENVDPSRRGAEGQAGLGNAGGSGAAVLFDFRSRQHFVEVAVIRGFVEAGGGRAIRLRLGDYGELRWRPRNALSIVYPDAYALAPRSPGRTL